MKRRQKRLTAILNIRLDENDRERLDRFTDGLENARASAIRQALRRGLDVLERERRENWGGQSEPNEVAMGTG